MRRSILVLLLIFAPAAATAQERGIGVRERADAAGVGAAGERVALVIGNGAYETAPLDNPVNDARDLAAVLDSLGFDVIRAENQSLTEMKRAAREFGSRLRSGAVGLFFYAGHALQMNGRNYLLPVDAVIESEEEVEYEGLDVGFVLAQLEAAANPLNILILDACRNNPFERGFRSAQGRGLATVDAPTGTLIAYATAPGNVASDGAGRNGLYTQELLRHIRTAGLPVEDVMKRVRVGVVRVSEGRQVPWESTSLVGDFYFAPPTPAAASPAPVAASTSAPPLAASTSAPPVAVPLTSDMTLPRVLNGENVARALALIYPPEYRASGRGGRVLVRMLIDESGRVADRLIHTSSGDEELDELALLGADIFEFSPAKKDGVPVAVWVAVPVAFQVE